MRVAALRARRLECGREGAFVSLVHVLDGDDVELDPEVLRQRAGVVD